MPRSTTVLTLLLASLATVASAQEPLTLPEAVARARRQNPEVREADARLIQASERTTEAGAGLLPRLDLSEGWQRSDLPVFAFSSLLSQRRFTASDFELARLNQPDAVDNFRAALVIEQPVFDGALMAARRVAAAGHDMARLEREHVAQRTAVATVEAYGRVQQIEALAAAARAAVEAADEDLRRAADRRDAGLSTDADVLMVTVHRAAAEARRIQAEADANIARARLNLLMGDPIDAQFTLAPLDPPAAATGVTIDDENAALSERPDVQLAAAAERAARLDLTVARAAFLPQVVARGAAEWNGHTYGARAGGWMVGAEVRFNVFRGFADRARLARASALVDERRLARDAATDAARLDVRAAASALTAAAARIELAETAVSAARESQRILRDRYDNGLASMADVLHASEAVLDADSQAISAASDRATAHARLLAALGRL